MPWDLFLMKMLLKSEICGSCALFTEHTGLIKGLKSQQTIATIHE